MKERHWKGKEPEEGFFRSFDTTALKFWDTQNGGFDVRFSPHSNNWKEEFLQQKMKDKATLKQILKQINSNPNMESSQAAELLQTGIKGVGQFMSMIGLQVGVLSGLVHNPVHFHYAKVSKTVSNHKKLIEHGFKPDFLEELPGKVMSIMKEKYHLELKLDEVENVICEVIREKPKLDFFFKGQNLYIVWEEADGTFVVKRKKYGKDSQWETIGVYEHPDIM